MRKKYFLADLYSAAKQHGGKSLAREYRNMHTAVPWMCKKGHTWDAPFEYIIAGAWCPQCYRDDKKRGWIDRLYTNIEKRNGKLVSPEPEKSTSKIKVECDRKHIFNASAKFIHDGWWCKKCAADKMKERAFERIKNVARKKGGTCVSDKYNGNKSLLKFQCSNGHVWSATAFQIDTSWCPQCRINAKQEKQLKTFREHAKKKGGKLLSTLFKDTHSKLLWECKEGHHWLATPHAVVTGSKSWCPECGDVQRHSNRRRHTIEAIQKEAKKRGGKLLSKEYTSTEQKLHWECAKKHRWYAEWANVYYNDAWCQKCYWEERGKTRDKLGRYA